MRDDYLRWEPPQRRNGTRIRVKPENQNQLDEVLAELNEAGGLKTIIDAEQAQRNERDRKVAKLARAKGIDLGR